MTARRRIHETVKEFMGRCEARMVEGRKRTIDTEGVFLSQMSSRTLMAGAQRNLSQLQGPALNPGVDIDPEAVMTAAADVCNYVMVMATKIIETPLTGGAGPPNEGEG